MTSTQALRRRIAAVNETPLGRSRVVDALIRMDPSRKHEEEPHLRSSWERTRIKLRLTLADEEAVGEWLIRFARHSREGGAEGAERYCHHLVGLTAKELKVVAKVLNLQPSYTLRAYVAGLPDRELGASAWPKLNALMELREQESERRGEDVPFWAL